MSKIIPEGLYRKIISSVPILTVDALIQNKRGNYLLVKRNNKPLKGQWFVSGGRVYKNETLKNAIRRKVREELGLKVIWAKPIGYYEDFYKSNAFNLKEGVHTVSVVFKVKTRDLNVRLSHESSNYRFGKLPKRFKIKRI